MEKCWVLQLKTRSSSSIGKSWRFSSETSSELPSWIPTKFEKKRGPLDIRDVRLATGMGCSPIFFNMKVEVECLHLEFINSRCGMCLYVCVAQNLPDDPFFVETKKCRHDRCEADVKKVASLDLQSERCLSGAKKGRELMDVGETLGAVERYVI